MTLLDLPSELLLDIVQPLHELDLARVSRTCKYLRILSESLLYRTFISLSPKPVSEDATKVVAKGLFKLRRFLRTVLQHPRLAFYIQNIEIDFSPPKRDGTAGLLSESPMEREMHDLCDEMRELYGRAAEQFALSTQWSEDLLRGLGDDDAELALLLLLAPNLVSLLLRLPPKASETGVDDRDNYHFQTVFRRAVESHTSETHTSESHTSETVPIPKFERLKTVTLGSVKSALKFCHVLDILQFPKLETIFATCNQDNSAGPPKLSRVLTLALHCEEARSEQVVSMIESCKDLRRLNYTFVSGMKCEDLRKGLWNHRNQLEVLGIQRRSRVRGDNIDMDPIGSLHDFTTLRHLELSQDALLGWPPVRASANHQGSILEGLPPNLQRFTISYGGLSLLLHLKNLVVTLTARTGPRFCIIEFRRFYPFAFASDTFGLSAHDHGFIELIDVYRKFLRQKSIMWIVNGHIMTSNDDRAIDYSLFELKGN